MDNGILIKKMINEIQKSCIEKLNIMEVCGTHTQAISRSGIRSLLPPNLVLLSGPGCPVCVTDESLIDAAVEILRNDIILATFGDMVRIRGSLESISDQLHKRKNIFVLYSPLDCLELARDNPDKQVVFFAAGFETTAPGIALTVKLAYEENLHNLSFLTSLKLMPPVLHKILREKQKKIHGLICPGHVAAVMGAGYFRFVAGEYGINAAVCGFEPLDIASGLLFLTKKISSGYESAFANLYESCVSEEGNETAREIMMQVFDIADGNWRGIGEIKKSELFLNENYCSFDALKKFNIRPDKFVSDQRCNCSDVILGNIMPYECRLFGKACTPQKPAGPCMISSEGSCSAYYRYWEAGL